MTTKELEDILRLDASAPEGEESDTELLLYVMGVLADRKKNNSTGKTASEAWVSFQQNYLPDDELFPEDKPKYSGSRKNIPWLRRMIAAAAVVALLVYVPVTANAFSWEDLWNIVAHWAKETFSFVSGDPAEVTEPDTEYSNEVASLRELLVKAEIDPDIVPTWIPEGFVLERIERDSTPMQDIYLALYLDGNKKLTIRVQTYLSDEFQKVEILDVSEIYTVSETEYYIFENTDHIQIIWYINRYECHISGDLTINEARKMIDSIEKE
jgi:hypothetical protein